MCLPLETQFEKSVVRLCVCVFVCVCTFMFVCVRVFVQQYRATPWLNVLNNWWLHPSLSLSLLLQLYFYAAESSSLLFHSTDVANPSLTLGSADGGPEGLWGYLNHIEWTFLIGQQHNELWLSDDGFSGARSNPWLAGGHSGCSRPKCKTSRCEAVSVSMANFSTAKPPVHFILCQLSFPVHNILIRSPIGDA